MSKLGRLAPALLWAGPCLTLNAAAQAPGRIQGAVTDRQGEPLPACAVELISSSDGRRMAMIDVAGRAAASAAGRLQEIPPAIAADEQRVTQRSGREASRQVDLAGDRRPPRGLLGLLGVKL